MSKTEPLKKEYLDDRWFAEFDGKVGLAGVKCKTCNKAFFPPKQVCPECFYGELELHRLSMRGTLHTFSRSDMGVAGLETPYVFGFIDLPEKIKLFGLITDCDPYDRNLKIGMEMEIYIDTVRKEPSGKEITAYKFRPAGGLKCGK